jgi:hypothetical protein
LILKRGPWILPKAMEYAALEIEYYPNPNPLGTHRPTFRE